GLGFLQKPDDLLFRKALLHVRLLLRKRTLLDSGWPCLQGAGQYVLSCIASRVPGDKSGFANHARNTPAAVLSVVGAKTAATRGVRRQLLKQRLVETLVEHLAFGFELIGKFKPNRHIQSVQHALQHCDELRVRGPGAQTRDASWHQRRIDANESIFWNKHLDRIGGNPRGSQHRERVKGQRPSAR
ncbi:hypothetical protein QZM01_28615, partial [Burkholderia multivorans]|nr:hypothetical protein [Burkholderia multivorans]